MDEPIETVPDGSGHSHLDTGGAIAPSLSDVETEPGDEELDGQRSSEGPALQSIPVFMEDHPAEWSSAPQSNLAVSTCDHNGQQGSASNLDRPVNLDAFSCISMNVSGMWERVMKLIDATNENRERVAELQQSALQNEREGKDMARRIGLLERHMHGCQEEIKKMNVEEAKTRAGLRQRKGKARKN